MEFSKKTSNEHTIERMYHYVWAKNNLKYGFYQFPGIKFGGYHDPLTLKNASLDELKRFNKGHEAIISFQKKLKTMSDVYVELCQFKLSQFTDFCLDIFNEWVRSMTRINHDNYTLKEMLLWYDMIYLDSENEYDTLTDIVDTIATEYFPQKENVSDIQEISQYIFEKFVIEREN